MAALTEDQIKSTFDLFDADASGTIDVDELGLVMEGLGFGVLSQDDLEDLIRQLDSTGSGVITYDGFKQLCQQKYAPKDSVEEMWLAFQSFDHGGKGRVTVGDLGQVARSIGEEERPELYKQVINLLYPRGGADGIQFAEWKQMCREAIATKRQPVRGELGEPEKAWRSEPQTQHYFEPCPQHRIEGSSGLGKYTRREEA